MQHGPVEDVRLALLAVLAAVVASLPTGWVAHARGITWGIGLAFFCAILRMLSHIDPEKPLPGARRVLKIGATSVFAGMIATAGAMLWLKDPLLQFIAIGVVSYYSDLWLRGLEEAVRAAVSAGPRLVREWINRHWRP